MDSVSYHQARLVIMNKKNLSLYSLKSLADNLKPVSHIDVTMGNRVGGVPKMQFFGDHVTTHVPSQAKNIHVMLEIFRGREENEFRQNSALAIPLFTQISLHVQGLIQHMAVVVHFLQVALNEPTFSNKLIPLQLCESRSQKAYLLTLILAADLNLVGGSP